MAGINLTIHLEYDEVVKRLKSEGWIIPVRCRECKHNKGACIDLWGNPTIKCIITGQTHSGDWFCADGKRNHKPPKEAEVDSCNEEVAQRSKLLRYIN